MPNPVVNFEIHCADATVQQKFYADPFDGEGATL
jgi:hypothetical protein